MSKNPCVYIMANKKNGTLYTGVTSNLMETLINKKKDKNRRNEAGTGNTDKLSKDKEANQKQIANQLGKRRKWVNNQMQKHEVICHKNPDISAQKIVLAGDTTSFNQFGIMLFRAVHLKANFLWYEVQNESNEFYRKGIQEFLDDGWEILTIVADGKPGLKRLFPSISFQLCQFHQFQTVPRYISKNPQLEAGQELREIMFRLKETDKASFNFWREEWHEKWKNFLSEKTENIITEKKVFTHQRIRQAFFSIQRSLPYVFTFEDHFKKFQIPNTTNIFS